MSHVLETTSDSVGVTVTCSCGWVFFAPETDQLEAYDPYSEAEQASRAHLDGEI